MVVPYYGGRANIPPSRVPAGYEFDPKAFMQGARKWWPDTQRVAGQMWAGLPHLGAQIVGGEPASPAATFIRQSLTGTPYALQHLVEPKGATPSATPQQVASAGKQAARYAAGYLDPDTLTKRWTTHPGQVTADIAPALAMPADLLGEAGIAALPRAAQIALRAARAGSYVASPATAPLAALGAGAKGARGLLRGPVTDATGAFTPAAVAAGKQAGLNPVDLEHPDFKPIYQQTLEQKGPTKAAAQEAIARYHSPNPQAPVSRQMVTQRSSPQAAQPKTADLIDQAKQNNAARAQQLARSPGPSPEEVAATAAPPAPSPGGPSLAAPDTASPGDFTSLARRPSGTPWTAPPDTAATRQRVLATKDDGTLAMPTDRIRTFLDTPQGQAAFPDPLDRSNVNILAAHNDMITAPPSGSGGSFWAGARKLGAMGAGALMTNVIPGGAPAARIANVGIGAFTGARAEDWLEKGYQGLQKGAAGRGAPTPGGPLVNAPLAVAGAAAPLAQAGPYVAPVASRTGAPPPPPPVAGVPADIPPAWQEQPLADSTPSTSEAAPPTTTAKGKAPRNDDTPTDIPPAWKEQPLTDEPAPQADGGRVGFAVGGQVADMTEHLLKRAEGAQKAAQASTKPLLTLSDDTVAKALAVAGRAI
jgi:hypothetical protein